MMRARAVAQAAFLSITLLLSSATAAPLDRAFAGVEGTLSDNFDLPFVRTVAGDASEGSMRVRWDCGQPQPCVVEGAQLEWLAQHFVMVPPDGAETPSELFILLPQGSCLDVGNTARAGGWFNGVGFESYQCFTLNPRPRVFRRSDLPPVQVVLPPNIRTLAREAQAEAQRRNRVRSTP